MMADKKNWLRLLAYVTDSINQELLLRTEYLAAENRILKSQIEGRLQLSVERGRPWPRLPNVWGGKLLRKSPVLPSRTRFLPGTESSLLRSSTDRRSEEWQVAREWIRQSKN